MISSTIEDYPEGVNYDDYLETSRDKSLHAEAYRNHIAYESDPLGTYTYIQVFDADNDKIRSTQVIDGNARCQSCSRTGFMCKHEIARRISERNKRLDTALSTTAEGVRTRIILVRERISRPGCGNFYVTTYLRKRYKLHPLVFSKLLSRNESARDALPSQRVCFELSVLGWHVTAAFVPAYEESDAPQTLIIWYQFQRSYHMIEHSNDIPKDALTHVLQNIHRGETTCSPADIWGKMSYGYGLASANNNTMTFVRPFAQYVVDAVDDETHKDLVRLEQRLRVPMPQPSYLDTWGEAMWKKENPRGPVQPFEEIREDVDWIRYKMHLAEAGLRQAMSSLAAFSDNTSPSDRVLNLDYETVAGKLRNAQHDIRDYFERRVGLESLKESRAAVEESRKNMKLADSVRRLTVIATFIGPLSLASSVFGMNIRELDQGPLAAWVPATVMTVVAAVVGLALVGMSHDWASRLSELWRSDIQPFFWKATSKPTYYT